MSDAAEVSREFLEVSEAKTTRIEDIAPTREFLPTLMAKLHRYTTEPCCSVPLNLESPDCIWHHYRSVHVQMAALLPALHTIETRAMAHALTFFRDTALKDTAEKVLSLQRDPVEDDPNAVTVLSGLLADLNRLIDSCGGEVTR